MIEAYFKRLARLGPVCILQETNNESGVDMNMRIFCEISSGISKSVLLSIIHGS